MLDGRQPVKNIYLCFIVIVSSLILDNLWPEHLFISGDNPHPTG